MNEIINKTKTEIEGLNQRFFLILENFVPTYIRYLQNPPDEEMIKEISHINSVNTQIESDGFTIKNMMESTIATDQDKINKLNDKIRVLKKENEYLKGEQRDLKIAANTSVGLFDNELDWYKKHGSIPDASVPRFETIEHHRESFEAFKRDRFKSWRTMPKVVKRIKRAAKKAANTPGLEKLTEEANRE